MLDVAETHGLNFVLATDGNPKIPEAFVRRPQLLEAIENYIVENLSKYNAQNFLLFEDISENLLHLMIENNVIVLKETPITGDYYKYVSKEFGNFRNSFLSNSETHTLAAEVGGRYYPDTFDAIEQDIMSGDGLLGRKSIEDGISKGISQSSVSPDPTVLNAEPNRANFLLKVNEAIVAVESASLANGEKATALAHLNAVKYLADQPDPPTEIIWQIISRASDLSGIASFFLALAMFLSAGS